MAARMIPLLWLRLVVLLAFIVFMAWESLWILVIVGIFLIALTGWQLYAAYRQRTGMDEG